jgi:hemoglobin
MTVRSGHRARAIPPAPRRYSLAVSEQPALPDGDARAIANDLIAEVVAEFYRRARRDGRLGPVFEAHVQEWDAHLARMVDFWSSALLRTGRWSDIG